MENLTAKNAKKRASATAPAIMTLRSPPAFPSQSAALLLESAFLAPDRGFPIPESLTHRRQTLMMRNIVFF